MLTKGDSAPWALKPDHTQGVIDARASQCLWVNLKSPARLYLPCRALPCHTSSHQSTSTGIVLLNTYGYICDVTCICGAQMHTSLQIFKFVAYIAALTIVLLVHAYALHLDESSETEPTRITQRKA